MGGNANTQIGQCVPSIAMEFLADNPCDLLGPVLGLPPHLVQHRQALPRPVPKLGPFEIDHKSAA